MIRSGNLFADLPAPSDAEMTTILADWPRASVERIVSTGQASPAGFWYDQDTTEWVILLQGAAGLLIEGEERERSLSPGDYVGSRPMSVTGSNGRSRTARRSGLPFTGLLRAACGIQPDACEWRSEARRSPSTARNS